MIRSGYKTITPTQLANVLQARKAGGISFAALRTYFACQAIVAIREAAERGQRKQGKKPKALKRYRTGELSQLTKLPDASVRRALRELERAGVLSFSESDIVIGRECLPGSEAWTETLSCKRSPERPIPVPRAMLRFLAQSSSEILVQVVCGYLVRGLSLARRTGEVSASGTVKASWMADLFDASHRAVKYAQAELMRLGWITKDTQSHQLKLNRHGAYFAINLEWREPALTLLKKTPTNDSQPDDTSAPLVHRDKQAVSIAPLPRQMAPDFAPPKKDKETSNENQNQETALAAQGSAGFCNERRKNPALRNIQPEDLFHFDRLEALYEQAVETGWIEPCEASALNFIAAAVRAREVGHEPPRVFVTLLRRKLWHHLTQAQEETARRALNRFREIDPDRFRVRRNSATMLRKAA